MAQPWSREVLLRRARRERDLGRAQLAHPLYHRALEETHDEGASIVLLHEMLDLCQDFFEEDSEATEQVAEALLVRQGGSDERALLALGKALSQRARKRWSEGLSKEAWELAKRSEERLTASLALDPSSSDGWGTLGGVRKRMAEWARQDGPAAARTYEDAMLEAYGRGAIEAVDAYPLLNFLEQRAVVAFRRRAGGTSPSTPLLGDDDEALRRLLDRALRIRERQFRMGKDRPWAAFDLARGQHYLKPNVPRFLNDLEVALEDARREARTASDRWMVATSRDSLAALVEARVDLEGLEEGIELLDRGVEDDRWMAGSWGPLGRPAAFLAPQLEEAAAAAQAELARLGAGHDDLRDRLRAFLDESERRWSEADEAAYEREAKDFVDRECTPASRKALRVLWKIFGAKAVGAGLAAVPVPGAALIGPMVSSHIADAIGSRL